MKALVVEESGVVRVREVSEPVMGEYEARCEMLYGATCAGTDLSVIDGEFAWGNVYPSIIGHESIGRVVEVGNKVRNFKVGDLISRVYTRETDGVGLSWGGMAEFGLAVDTKAMWADGIDKEEWDGFRVNQVIPEGVIDPLDATMIITWRENLSWINRMGVTQDEKVLVVGSGANGISIAACAAIRGGQVVVIGNEAREESAMRTGIRNYYDYKKKEVVKEFIDENERMYDYVIDATGKKETLTPYMTMLKEGGTAAVYGMSDFYNYTFNPILGPKSFRFFNSYVDTYDEEETHEEVIDLIRAGKLDAGNWLDKENIFTWENAPEVYEHVRNRKAIKSVLKLSR
ncbi:threonine dehydrogenase-like Zn-dependent dehydrogenase [Aequitasia blattaphilus]|uniref:Zinc-binding dehydrogenase n=1 Tax=Aequitasia blattaphilus TaxID=2949332 RepID=A0ABT1EEX0_9FIRM|nr:zinc-binding dehydrogenase [Aequitasia blattaphilus]MCP1103012.1 zinc-binding dehydrogenase [Aequitasia blattaphilus]MCR8615652.1 zinc-binding dehydrogenase [Aequitasia blattaphilus]